MLYEVITGQARAGLRQHPEMAGVTRAQTLEAFAGQRPRRRQDTDNAAAAERSSRLDAGFERHHGQGRGRPDRFGGGGGCRVAGDHQRLGATPGERRGDAHAALRITSYNVCYTKLLRSEKRSSSELWTNTRVPFEQISP